MNLKFDSKSKHLNYPGSEIAPRGRLLQETALESLNNKSTYDTIPRSWVLTPIDDTYVGGSNAVPNKLELKVRNDNGGVLTSLLKFDIPPGHLSGSAKLRLYISNVGLGSRIVTVSKMPRSFVWTEEDLLPNDFDPTTAVYDIIGNSVKVFGSQQGTWIDIEVGDLMSPGEVTLALSVIEPFDGFRLIAFGSKEDEGKEPAILLDSNVSAFELVR